MFMGGLILNPIYEIYCILKFNTSNTNVLLNSNVVPSILLRKVQFW